MKAMILAAGLGTRMGVLAHNQAKPALPVLDVPVVLRLVRTLAENGVSRVVVNTHAHPETLHRALADAPVPVDWVEEPELRGSGGGIRGARAWLEDDEPFLVLNGDMCLDLDLPALLAHHRARGALLTLALRHDPREREFGSIGYDADGDVRRITERIDLRGEKGSGLFIGVQLMEQVVLSRLPTSARFEIIPELWLPALREGARITTWLQPAGARWWPVGSPHELLEANLAALRSELPPDGVHVDASALVHGELTGSVWIGADAVVETGARVGPNAVLCRGARVGAGARLEDAVALPEATVATDARLECAIAFGNEVWRDE